MLLGKGQDAQDLWSQCFCSWRTLWSTWWLVKAWRWMVRWWDWPEHAWWWRFSLDSSVWECSSWQCSGGSWMSAFFSSYQEARKRLVEKTRSRGFWSNSKGKGSFGKKGFGKQKGKGFRTKSLAQRIAESSCRRCGATGHWKAECPLNQTSSSDGKNAVPTSIVIDHEAAAVTVVEPNVDADTFSMLKTWNHGMTNRISEPIGMVLWG